MKSMTYEDYTVQDNGIVLGPDGKEIKRFNKNKNSGIVYVTINKKTYTLARLIYKLFVGEIQNNEIIVYKDGDYSNCSAENLGKKNVSDNLPQKERKLDAETRRSIYFEYLSGNFFSSDVKYITYKRLADKYGVSPKTLHRIIEEEKEILKGI